MAHHHQTVQVTTFNILLLLTLLPELISSRAVMDLAAAERPLRDDPLPGLQSPQLVSDWDRAPTWPSETSSKLASVESANHLTTSSQVGKNADLVFNTALMLMPGTSLSKRHPQVNGDHNTRFSFTTGLIMVWRNYQSAIPNPIKDSINQVVIPLTAMYTAIIDAATTKWTTLREATSIDIRYGHLIIRIRPFRPSTSSSKIPWEFVASFARNALVLIAARGVATFEGYAYWMGTYTVFMVAAVITPPANITG